MADRSKADVFVSYSRVDEESARRLVLRFEEEKHVWIDRFEMEGGRDWWPPVTDAIDRVAYLVLLVTPDSLASAVVAPEWLYARKQGVFVVPAKASLAIDFDTMPQWMKAKHF